MADLFENALRIISARLSSGHHDHPLAGYRMTSAPGSSYGFWGKPSSTVDWCENNYEITIYLAEFFNTLSSLAMVACGLLGIAFHWKDFETRFSVAFGSVAVVGVGSMAFHGTLWFSLQMLDELPMIYTSLVLAYCVIQHDYVKPRYLPALPIALIIHGLLTTILVASPALAPQYASPLLQFICFHISFALLEIFLFYKTTIFWMNEKDPKMKRLHVIGVLFWVAGIVCWALDYAGCEPLWEGKDSIRKLYMTWQVRIVDLALMFGAQPRTIHFAIPNPQLHAWWHICASTGLYLMTLVVAQNRALILGYQAEIRWFYVLPYVHVIQSEKAAADRRKGVPTPSVDDPVTVSSFQKCSRGGGKERIEEIVSSVSSQREKREVGRRRGDNK